MDAVKKMRMNKGSPVGQANFEVALQYAFNKFEKVYFTPIHLYITDYLTNVLIKCTHKKHYVYGL